MLRIVYFLFFFALPVYSYSQNSNEKDPIIATIGNKTLRLKEFNNRYDRVLKAFSNPPSREVFLEELVRYFIGVQEAQKRKLAEDPEVIDRMQQEMYKVMLEKDLEKQIEKIVVTEKEMKSYYQKNPEIRSSHILIESKPEATPAQRQEARKRAEEILKEVKASKRPFEDLVKLYSDDILTKQNRGDLGFQSRATLEPKFYEALLGIKVNSIQGLIESNYGFHIVKVTERRSYENANKRQLRPLVYNDKKLAIFNDYFSKLKPKYKIEVNKNLIQ